MSLQAGAEGPLRSHCSSHRDQLQQFLQVLNSICNLPRMSTLSLFLGPLLLPQFTKRQRKITITSPSPPQQNPAQLHFSNNPVQY